MTKNHSRTPGLRSVKMDWNHFDHGISQETRDFINFIAPKACMVSTKTFSISQRNIEEYLEACAKDTLRVYGPDHPQAWKDKTYNLSDVTDWTD